MKKEISVRVKTPILGGDVPTGGTTGQVLKKKSDVDNDVIWDDVPAPEGVENTSNKVQEIGSGSEDKYPSTKAVKDYAQPKEEGKGLSSADFTSEEKTKLGALPNAVQLADALNGKVATVPGKGLSKNDYSDEEKQKVASAVTAETLALALASKQENLTVQQLANIAAVPNKADASNLADYDSIIGIGTAVVGFDPDTPYQKGRMVLHRDQTDGKLKAYEFTDFHPAGEWTGADVKIANIYNLFANYAGTDTEKVYVQLASSDGLLTLSGIEVTANYADGGIETKEADANGRCVFNVTKGRVYTISVAQLGSEGYAFCPAQMGKATADDRYMYFEYSKIGGGYCTVKVYAYALGVRPSDASAWEDKQVQLSLSDGTLQSESFDSNGVATFSNVPQNASGTIVCPKVSGYSTPKNLTILTGFTEQDIQANYGSLSAPGIYFTLNDETDVDASALTAEDIPNIVAIHVATETLINANSDFYVRPTDLWNTTSKPNLRWCNANPSGQYPSCNNVPVWDQNSPYYDGKTASANMYSDLLVANTDSTPLNECMAQTIVTNNRTVYGFMPTRDQFQVLVDNYESINGMIKMIDGTKSAAYLTKYWWMATNNSNRSIAWYWGAGGWGGNGYRLNALASWFPFFAI